MWRITPLVARFDLPLHGRFWATAKYLTTVVVELYRVRYPDSKVRPILRPERILATDNG
jgi:hypothetical protein